MTDQTISTPETREREVARLQARVTALEEALKPLSELLISADAIECALKRLGPIALRDEAYVNVATETLVRIMRLAKALTTPAAAQEEKP